MIIVALGYMDIFLLENLFKPNMTFMLRCGQNRVKILGLPHGRFI